MYTVCVLYYECYIGERNQAVICLMDGIVRLNNTVVFSPTVPMPYGTVYDTVILVWYNNYYSVLYILP